MTSDKNRPLWEPPLEVTERANITRYADAQGRGASTPEATYRDLWAWSVDDLEGFWESLWRYYEIKSSAPYTSALESRAMPGARWFPGSMLNYAEHVFRGRDPIETAITAKTESGGPTTLSWAELEGKTGALAAALRSFGVRPGDRVAAYLPNVPEAVVSVLATASIGATWSSCAPDFGSTSAVDRFKQITPKVLIAAGGYEYRGKWHSKVESVEEMRASIPSIERTVLVDWRDGPENGAVHRWEDLTHRRERLGPFEQVPFEHPLWILYSSGTTGLPKPLVHSHGGILLEHFKAVGLHNDLHPQDRMFWYSSTGWMMWNYLVSSLLLGAQIILYDGDPLYPDAHALWELAETTGMTFFGASAAFVAASMKSGIEPGTAHDLSRLRGFGSTGSALPPEGFAWVYSKVKPDIWLASISGGTDLCTAFVGGCPLLPVRAGEIQCRYLGASVLAFDEEGRPVLDQMGELVLTEPMPSMPVFFWGDGEGRELYRESYFGTFPGVWRHGDWIRIDSKSGGCIIYGRSDATIKRMGVRMGTSEIYRVVESIPQIIDSLVVDTESLGGRSYMPLFVVLRGDAKLDAAMKAAIVQKIRIELSPRMVPDEIIAVSEVPKTLNGKKLEVPVRRIFLGADPAKVFNPGSVKNPQSMEFFLEFAKALRRRGADVVDEGPASSDLNPRPGGRGGQA